MFSSFFKEYCPSGASKRFLKCTFLLSLFQQMASNFRLSKKIQERSMMVPAGPDIFKNYHQKNQIAPEGQNKKNEFIQIKLILKQML